MIKKKQIFIAALFSGLSLYATDQSSLKEKAATALANADAAIVQTGEKVGDAVQGAVDAAEAVVQTVAETAEEIAENIKKTEEETEDDADADYTIAPCKTVEIENMYQLLDTVFNCFKKIHEHAQKKEDISVELATEVQGYVASEEIMDAVLLYAWQKGEVEVALTILSFIRAEAFVKGGERRTRGWSDSDGDTDSWSWSSDEESDFGDEEGGSTCDPKYHKFIAAVTVATAGFIAISSYYGWFQQPDMSDLSLD